MKKLFISIILLTFSSLSHASDLSKLMNDVWNDMQAGSNATGGTSITNQGSSYYSGGGYSYTAPSSTFQPLSVRPPSVKAGCTGISIDAGAFNYSGEEMIAFLKSIISGAPGYAFNLAMQILCPSCTDLMNTINDISAMINSMQMDSCAALDI